MSDPYIIHTFTENRWPPDSRRCAVATLKEARDAAERAATSAPGYTATIGFPTQDAIADALPGSGGTIGPLPDGTVIEVERVAWYKLAIRADLLPRWQQGADTPRVGMVKAEIIDAFNARNAV